MKKVLLLSFLALGSFATFAQSKSKKVTDKPTTSLSTAATTATTANTVAGSTQDVAPNGTTLEFNKTTYEFGTIPQGTPAEAEFVFTNTGKEPLIIQRVNAACGCTTPYYTQEPVAPGKTGVIKATYNAAAPGGFNKPVTVIYNGGQTQLNLKGVVEKAPEGSVPENKSSVLKK
jgi:hypothetical protein